MKNTVKSEPTIHARLVFLWLVHPHIDYNEIVRMGIWLDCFKEDKAEESQLLYGIVEEVFIFLNPISSERVFFYWGVIRYIEEVMTVADQRSLIGLLHQVPIASLTASNLGESHGH